MQDFKIDYLPNGYFNQLETIDKVLFTVREIDIIACVVNMRGSSKIASILNISPRTVETHIFNIKRKIDNNAREGVIDFVERSGKSFLMRKHYQNLLIQTDFNKKLKSIAKLIHNNTEICYFFCCNKQDKESIISIIQNHLKLADVKLKICSINQEFIKPKQTEHFIYVVSNKESSQLAILTALHESKRTPTLFTFLAIETINNHDLYQELIDSPFINFSECKNYYLKIFEIFKRIYPKTNFNNLFSHLEQYHHSITEHQEVIPNNSNHCLETTNTNFTYKINLGKGIKWLIATLFLLILTIGFNKIMLKELNKDRKNMNQPFSNSPHIHFITSYIPEILTGHEHFIGRKKELQQIEQHFTKDNIVVITGPAGIGKSTCAIEFGKRYKKQHIVRYFNTEFKTKIDQQYRELAQELNISLDQQSQNVIMQLVNSRLSSLTTKILFIFDNLDLYDDAKEYLINLPTNVYVIITTRQPRLISHIQHVVLEEFSFQEAEVYLKNSLYNRNLTTDLIQQLVKTNGTLPYDLKCVAAYLLDNPSIDNQTAINKTKIKDTLFKEFIVNSNPTKQQAWKILQYASHLDPDFINIEIVKKLFPTQIKLSSNALKKLESLSLVSTINNQNDQAEFRIHRNLQINI